MSKIFKYISYLILLFVIIFLLKLMVSDEVKKDSSSGRLIANHVAGRTEKIKEKLTLLTKISKEKKLEYYKYLSEKRLAEFVYITSNNQINLVEEVSSRYSTYIGTLTDYLVANNVKGGKDEILKMYEDHKLVITTARDKFEHDSGWWLAIQHDINTIDILSSRLRSI